MSRQSDSETPVSEPPPTELVATSNLDRMLDEYPDADPDAPLLEPAGVSGSLVGEVVDTEHPSLRGRVRVRWKDLEGQIFERWLPTLHGLPVRVADRVLMTQASNFTEHIVLGVLDGFARRPEPTRETGATLELKRDEALRVLNQAGEELLEVFEDESGPVVRLLQDGVNIDLPGELRLSAKSIELVAKRGPATITASDDVVVQGEAIHLN